MHTMDTFDLNAQAARVHVANAKWWVDLETGAPLDRNWGEMCMLVVSELSEALEGARKNLPDDKLPHRPMLEVELADAMIRLLDMAGFLKLDMDLRLSLRLPPPVMNIGDELFKITHTVIMIRASLSSETVITDASFWFREAIAEIVALSQWLGYDIFSAYEEKMSYNAIRHDHTPGARKQAHGKKF